MDQPEAITEEERQRLRAAFEALPKTPHGELYRNRHEEIEPEWIMQIINRPFDWRHETSGRGEALTIYVGRVAEHQQWIKVILVGTGADTRFLTAYSDRRLEADYGGRPWNRAL